VETKTNIFNLRLKGAEKKLVNILDNRKRVDFDLITELQLSSQEYTVSLRYSDECRKTPWVTIGRIDQYISFGRKCFAVHIEPVESWFF